MFKNRIVKQVSSSKPRDTPLLHDETPIWGELKMTLTPPTGRNVRDEKTDTNI